MNYGARAKKMRTSIGQSLNLHNANYWTVESDALDSKYVRINEVQMSRKKVPDLEKLKAKLEDDWIHLPAHSYTFIMYL